MLRIIFFGTGKFAEPIFERLIQDKEIEMIALVTAPDKPVGRKQILTPPEVKLIAQKYQIPVFQPEKVKSENFLIEIRKLLPDLAIVVSYGKILPAELLEIPKHKFLNIHPSLLPKYRGASPIQFALLNGEKKTGVSIIQVTSEVDAGPIISQEEMFIRSDDDYLLLQGKLSRLAAKMIGAAVEKWIGIRTGEISEDLIIQDGKRATYTKILTKQDGRIDWSKSAAIIVQQVKAFNPWPGTWTIWRGKILKIIKVGKIIKDKPKSGLLIIPGQVIEISSGFGVQTGQGVLEILEIQPSGKRPMPIQDFLRGHQQIVGERLE